MRRPLALFVVGLAVGLPLNPAPAQEVRAAGIIDGVVTDTNLVPLPGVEVTILRTSIRVFSGENGRFQITSLPSGDYLLAARHLGFLPISRLVRVVEGDTLRLSILMQTTSQSLDTIRVSGNGDPAGFSWRRSLGAGQFITPADIDRENPRNTTSLIRTRDAMRYAFDNEGQPFVTMAAGPGGNCNPFIFLDGFPIQGGSRLGLDWALHPEEIGGVEIYVNPSQVPAQFRGFTNENPSCGVVVFWTRDRLGIPPKPAASRALPLGIIDGTVTDSSLVPLADATISVLGASTQVVTRSNGGFRLVNVPPGSYRLLVRRIGFEPMLAPVQVTGGDTARLSFNLSPATTTLDTVTVKGQWLTQAMREFEARRNLGFGHFITGRDRKEERRRPLGFTHRGAVGQDERRLADRSSNVSSQVLSISGLS